MDQDFGKRLKKQREALKLTLTEVARAIEVPKTTYADWENGRGLRMIPLKKLSQVLAISVTELVVGERSSGQEIIDELALIEKKVRELKQKIGSER
jgi:transcriptional regulator with XRE-family HTH domain